MREIGVLLGAVLLVLNLSIGVEWYVLATNIAFILATLFVPTRGRKKG